MFRRYIRLYVAAARRHVRLVAAGGVLLVVAMAALIVSCCDRRAAPIAPDRTPYRPELPPTAVGDIRVRLVDPTDAATIGATGPYRILVDGELRHTDDHPLGSADIHRGLDDWRLAGMSLPGERLTIEPASPDAFVTCNGRPYRGRLVVQPAAGVAGGFTINNELPLEHYLPGVLARELYGGWRLETYKALAVAARTYAMYEMTHNGRRRSFDVYADQRSQVYGGIDDETDKSVTAVRATYGLVISDGDGPTPQLVKTYYNSSCGGMTNPAEGLEPQDRPAAPLAGGVVCTDCSFASRYRWDTVRIDRAAAFDAVRQSYPVIAAMGPLETIRVRSTTAWGRPQQLDIVAANGRTEQIRADDLRLALLRANVHGAGRVYSMNCTLSDDGRYFVFANGRGFGHGVGLCQYGAEGKARRGMEYHEILYTYYPGATILRAY